MGWEHGGRMKESKILFLSIHVGNVSGGPGSPVFMNLFKVLTFSC